MTCGWNCKTQYWLMIHLRGPRSPLVTPFLGAWVWAVWKISWIGSQRLKQQAVFLSGFYFSSFLSLCSEVPQRQTCKCDVKVLSNKPFLLHSCLWSHKKVKLNNYVCKSMCIYDWTRKCCSKTKLWNKGLKYILKRSFLVFYFVLYNQV